MRKKGDLSINTVVVAALAMVVLIILIFVFKQQIGNVAGGFKFIGDDAKKGSSGLYCKTMLSMRECESKITSDFEKIGSALSPPCNPKEKDGPCTYEWKDCLKDDCYEIKKKTTP